MEEKTAHSPWKDWKITRILGKGSFGQVYEIERNNFGTVEKAAMKVIHIPANEMQSQSYLNHGFSRESVIQRNKEDMEIIAKEYTLMSQLKGNSNIVYADDICTEPSSDGLGWVLYIRMELLRPLYQAIRQPADEECVIRLGIDICHALSFCWQKNIIHRDIKPGNILVAPDGRYMLGDFGIARTVAGTCSGTRIGTCEFMAPEIYNNQRYGLSADLYSLGMTMYWILNSGCGPFLPLPPTIPKASQIDEAMLRRFHGEQLPPPVGGSECLKDIVLKACAFVPADRYQTPEEMQKDLEQLRETGFVYVWKIRADVTELLDTPANPSDSCTQKLRTTPPETAPSEPAFVLPEPRAYTDAPPELYGYADVPAEGQPEQRQGDKHTLTAFVATVILLGTILLLMMFEMIPILAGISSDRDIPADSRTAQTELPGTEHVHIWEEATYDRPKTCTVCGATEGAPLPTVPPETEHVHTWEEATYDRPKTCTVCGATEGDPLPRPGFRFADKLASGNYHSVLLRDDGTVTAAGYNGMGSKANYGGRCDTEDWSNMVCVAASSHTAGVRADGTVIATGLNESGQCHVEDWHDIASVAVSNHHTVGLRCDGTVVAVGANDYGQCEVSGWKDMIQVAASEETTYGLTSDGRILSVGKRSFGSGWRNVKKIAASAYNLVALLEDGTVVQEGASSGWDDTTDDWHDIVDIASGGAHTLGLTADGRVLGVMSPLSGRDHGQCDLYSWDDIVDISAGMFFSVGLRSDGTIVAAGDNTHGELDICWVKE